MCIYIYIKMYSLFIYVICINKYGSNMYIIRYKYVVPSGLSHRIPPNLMWLIIIVPTETTIWKAYLHFQMDTIYIYIHIYIYYTHTIYIFYNTHVGENFRYGSTCRCRFFFIINEFSPQGGNNQK